jgi:hypothetical protein
VWHDHSAVSQPFLIQAFLFLGFSVTQKRLDGKIGILDPKPAANTPQSGHCLAP